MSKGGAENFCSGTKGKTKQKLKKAIEKAIRQQKKTFRIFLVIQVEIGNKILELFFAIEGHIV